MPVAPSVQEFLRRADVPYSVFPHVPGYTATEDAAIMQVPQRNWAKAVVCFANGEPIQAVVPADYDVDLHRLGIVTGAKDIRLATEAELEWLFPDCEPGAMPPLGPLYKQLVFVDELLTSDREIVFNGGSHADAICMRFDDFDRIAHPVVARFARRR
jgi:Ala-tRNA(Pro) deacylase